MKIKSLLAGAVVAGIATVGTGGVAFAASSPPAPTPAYQTFCARWVPRLPALDAHRVRDEQRIDDLGQAIAVAKAHHREDLVERLERQLDDAQRDHTTVVAEIAVIHLRCHV